MHRADVASTDMSTEDRTTCKTVVDSSVVSQRPCNIMGLTRLDLHV